MTEIKLAVPVFRARPGSVEERILANWKEIEEARARKVSNDVIARALKIKPATLASYRCRLPKKFPELLEKA